MTYVFKNNGDLAAEYRRQIERCEGDEVRVVRQIKRFEERGTAATWEKSQIETDTRNAGGIVHLREILRGIRASKNTWKYALEMLEGVQMKSDTVYLPGETPEQAIEDGFTFFDAEDAMRFAKGTCLTPRVFAVTAWLDRSSIQPETVG